MPQRDELAEIAVALHVRRQQHHRNVPLFLFVILGAARNLSGSLSPLVTRNSPLNIQRYADNRLDARVQRFFVKRHGRIHAIRVCQRYSGHVLLDRCGDDLVGRRDAPQERIVAVTM